MQATARQPQPAPDGAPLHCERHRPEQIAFGPRTGQKVLTLRGAIRPALSDERVQLNAAGQVELKLETPWRDGTRIWP